MLLSMLPRPATVADTACPTDDTVIQAGGIGSFRDNPSRLQFTINH